MGKGWEEDMNLGLVSCTKSKRSYPCKAYEMYSPSNLFKKAYRYATRRYDKVVILSAKYGLLFPNDEIEPYELTLKSVSTKERRQWSNKVFKQMKERLRLNMIKRAFFHTGKEYREYLIPQLEMIGIRCFVPLKGLFFKVLWR